MIRAVNHSSYPRVADNPLDEPLRMIHRAVARGEASPEDVAAVEDEVTCVVVAEQSRAFIDVVTDGMVRWDGPISHLARHLSGLETRGLRRWLDSGLWDRQVAVVGPIARPRPFLVHDLAVAQTVAQKPVKIVLPGPATFARVALDEYYGDRRRLAHALAAALAEEVRDLSAAGARWFQLDEPLLCRHPEDLDLVAETAAEIFAAAGGEATTILQTYAWGADPSVLASRLGRIPGTHLGLDLVQPGSLALLAGLPAGRGVALGLFDARSTIVEDAADVAERLAAWREVLVQRDVLVGPNAGLESLPRDQAFDKLLQARYLVEKLRGEWTWAS